VSSRYTPPCPRSTALVIPLLVSLFALWPLDARAVQLELVRTIPAPENASRYLTGMAIDEATHTMYVADRHGHQVLTFDLDGNYLGAWGGLGTEPGQFNNPGDVELTGTGELLVADWMNHRIQVFDLAGNFLRQWGSEGTGPGQFHSPVDLAIDASGFVYVLDSYLSRVQKFTSSGDYVLAWGSPGSAHGEFQNATGIDVDAEGHVVLADQVNFRLEYFDGSGTYLHSTPTQSTGITCQPAGVSVDADGRAFCAGWTGQSAAYDADGQAVAEWTTPCWAVRVLAGQSGLIYVTGWTLTAEVHGIYVYALPTPVQSTTWSAVKRLID